MIIDNVTVYLNCLQKNKIDQLERDLGNRNSELDEERGKLKSITDRYKISSTNVFYVLKLFCYMVELYLFEIFRYKVIVSIFLGFNM